jgi:hypothetical protein
MLASLGFGSIADGSQANTLPSNPFPFSFKESQLIWLRQVKHNRKYFRHI